MTVPFRSFAIDEAGMAAYLRILDAGGSFRAALLVINCIGEPIEFCHAEIVPPSSALWRASDVRRRCSGALARSLFETCSSQPRIVFALASELDPAVFRGDVKPAISACRVIEGDPAQSDEGELATAQGPRLIWAAEKPPSGSPERQLLNRLIEHDLLVEPFERAAAGLSERAVDGHEPG